MTTDFSNVFHAFVEAEKAMIELPEVRGKLAEAEATIARHEDHIDTLNMDILRAESKISELSSRITVLEAALAEATFRGEADRNLVETLRRLLGFGGDGNGGVQPVATEAPAPAQGNSGMGESVSLSSIAEPENVSFESAEQTADAFGNVDSDFKGQSEAEPTAPLETGESANVIPIAEPSGIASSECGEAPTQLPFSSSAATAPRENVTNGSVDGSGPVSNTYSSTEDDFNPDAWIPLAEALPEVKYYEQHYG